MSHYVKETFHKNKHPTGQVRVNCLPLIVFFFFLLFFSLKPKFLSFLLSIFFGGYVYKAVNSMHINLPLVLVMLSSRAPNLSQEWA